MHTCSPSGTWEAETERSRVQGQPELHSLCIQKKKWEWKYFLPFKSVNSFTSVTEVSTMYKEKFIEIWLYNEIILRLPTTFSYGSNISDFHIRNRHTFCSLVRKLCFGIRCHLPSWANCSIWKWRAKVALEQPEVLVLMLLSAEIAGDLDSQESRNSKCI